MNVRKTETKFLDLPFDSDLLQNLMGCSLALPVNSQVGFVKKHRSLLQDNLSKFMARFQWSTPQCFTVDILFKSSVCSLVFAGQLSGVFNLKQTCVAQLSVQLGTKQAS